MWNMTKMQAQALDAALMDDGAEKQRAEERARVRAKDDEDPSEWELVVDAWEKSGLTWLKKGEAIFGPGFDFQSELQRLARTYAESRRLPYEHLNNLGVNVYAGFRAVFVHGLVALVLSVFALAAGAPLWFCGITSAFYLVWRFRARRTWLIKQRAAARVFRSEAIASRG